MVAEKAAAREKEGVVALTPVARTGTVVPWKMAVGFGRNATKWMTRAIGVGEAWRDCWRARSEEGG